MLGWKHLSKETLLAYRGNLQKAGFSQSNTNQVFKILARIFRIAADERLIQHQSAGEYQAPQRAAIGKGHLYAGAGAPLLIAAAPNEEWRALITLGYFTGGKTV